MKKTILTVVVSLLALAASCSSTGEKADAASSSSAQAKGGAELWGENCRRCHNIRSPSEFSDTEWEAIAFHMRVRANLTGNEYEQIRQFLLASN